MHRKHESRKNNGTGRRNGERRNTEALKGAETTVPKLWLLRRVCRTIKLKYRGKMCNAGMRYYIGSPQNLETQRYCGPTLEDTFPILEMPGSDSCSYGAREFNS